jgi:hypothetical protein
VQGRERGKISTSGRKFQCPYNKHSPRRKAAITPRRLEKRRGAIYPRERKAREVNED